MAEKIEFPFTEFVGSFLLVVTTLYASASAVDSIEAQRTKSCTALAAILVPVSYIFHRHSQVHLNPATTIAASLSNAIRPQEAGLYVFAQILGAIAAAICTSYATMTIPALATEGQPSRGVQAAVLSAELLYTCMMVYVALSVARDMPNTWFGLALGSVELSARCVAALSGACLNPAISFGIDFARHYPDGSWSKVESYNASIRYACAEVVGGIVAALLFCVTRPQGAGSQGSYNAALRMLSELVGTFFVVVTGCISGISSEASTAPAAAVLAFSYATAPVSGGYLNPAVTVSVVLDHHGAHDFEDMGLYLLAQLGASLAGSWVTQWWLLQQNYGVTCGWFSCESGKGVRPLPNDSTKVALGEFPFTLIVCLVALYTHHANQPPWHGAVVALCMAGGGWAANDLSGGILNPAIALARCILNDDPEGATSHIFCEVLAGLTATAIFWGLKLHAVGAEDGNSYEMVPQNHV